MNHSNPRRMLLNTFKKKTVEKKSLVLDNYSDSFAWHCENANFF